MMAMSSKLSSRSVSRSRSRSRSRSASKPLRLTKELDILPPRPVLFPWLPSIDIVGCCWGGDLSKQMEDEVGVTENHSLMDDMEDESTCSSQRNHSQRSNSQRSNSQRSSSRRSSNSNSNRNRNDITEWIQAPRRTEATRARRVLSEGGRRSRSKRKKHIERQLAETLHEDEPLAPSSQPAPARVLSTETSLLVELLPNMSDLSGSIASPKAAKEKNHLEAASFTTRTATTTTSTAIDDAIDDVVQDAIDDATSSVPDMSSIGDSSELEVYHSTLSSSPTHPWDEAPIQESTPSKKYDLPIAITAINRRFITTPLVTLTDVIFMILETILKVLSVRKVLFGVNRTQTQESPKMLPDRTHDPESSHHYRLVVDSVHQRDNHLHW